MWPFKRRAHVQQVLACENMREKISPPYIRGHHAVAMDAYLKERERLMTLNECCGRLVNLLTEEFLNDAQIREINALLTKLEMPKATFKWTSNSSLCVWEDRGAWKRIVSNHRSAIQDKMAALEHWSLSIG